MNESDVVICVEEEGGEVQLSGRKRGDEIMGQGEDGTAGASGSEQGS